jgi:hypothetical protein
MYTIISKILLRNSTNYFNLSEKRMFLIPYEFCNSGKTWGRLKIEISPN